jgi:hypothetical protein
MRTLRGKVSTRFGVAGGNLATVEGLILARAKLVGNLPCNEIKK